MRFVAGRGAVAEKLAGALWRRAWPRRCGGETGGAVAESHREDETRWVNAAIFADVAGAGKEHPWVEKETKAGKEHPWAGIIRFRLRRENCSRYCRQQ